MPIAAKAQHFDFLVIGGGSGGYAAACTARETCENVAIIDAAPELGGLCILRGCMPSKTLLYSAEVLHLAHQAKKFGLDIPKAQANAKALQARKKSLVREFAEYRQEQLQSDRFTLFRQHARFIDPDTVALDDGTQLTADHILIATGSVVAAPPLPGLEDLPVWTSDEILDLEFIPDSVIVLGGGIVACELAQFLHRIGTRVIQIQRSPQLLKALPSEAGESLARAFNDAGIELYTDTQFQNISLCQKGFLVTFKQAGKTKTVQAAHCLNALGRKPNTHTLNLKAAGIETMPTGHIACDDYQRSSNPRVYACGDVSGPHEIVHTAILQGECAARHATQRKASSVNYDHLVTVIFTDPQIATVGLSERQLKERGIDFLTAQYPFDDHGKSILMEAKYGYVKIYAARDGTLLGAECVSKDAGELIHALAVAVTLHAKVSDLLQVHWYHPTLSEIWTYPLEDILSLIDR
ncbi:MAG: Mercuric reductase [Opitutia bacterium UBA7350]|nr:MAG: Mercuric reductase [Opitutae bacterium UBA7350]